METELRRIEEMVGEVVNEMDYLRTREQKLRDTNESTNERVKWFAFGTMGMLVGLGAWQVVYLRAYFRYVRFLPCPRMANNVIIGRSILFRAHICPSSLVGQFHKTSDIFAQRAQFRETNSQASL